MGVLGSDFVVKCLLSAYEALGTLQQTPPQTQVGCVGGFSWDIYSHSVRNIPQQGCMLNVMNQSKCVLPASLNH